MTWNFPGARWWKFDFHTHTPASDDYGRGNNQAALRNLTPEDWLLGFMRAGIDCVAVTDHNSGAWIDRLKQALEELQQHHHPEYRPLFLFPGVEVAANGGVHILAIFDLNASSNTVTHLLGAIKFPQGTEGTSNAVSPLSSLEVIKAIAAEGGLPILAHADGPKGAFSVLQGLSLDQLLCSSELIGVEICDPMAPKPGGLRNSLHLSEVLGSDSHHPNGQAGARFPGSHFTWIKMGTPSFEGLRLALLDGAPLSIRRSDRQPADPDRHAEQLIEGVEISNARVCGRGAPLILRFNPWLNTLIGGRGTGKSTIVEFLRIGLRRDKELTGNVAKDFEDFYRVPRSRDDRGALTDQTEVRVFYLKDGTRFRLQWNQAGTLAPIESEQPNGGWQAEAGDIIQRFPVRIFSQKQVFSLSENEAGLRRIVDEAREVNRSEWDRRWREFEVRFLALRAKERELTERRKAVSRLQGELADLTRKLAVFASADHAATLKAYQRRQRQNRELAHVVEDVARIVETLDRAREEAALSALDISLFDEKDPSDREVLAELDRVKDAIASVQREIATLKNRVTSAGRTWREALAQSKWKKELAAVEARYHQWVEKLRSQGVADPAQFGQLVQRRQVVEQEIKALERLKETIQQVQIEAAQVRDEMLSLRGKLTEDRGAFLATALRDNPFVRIDVRPYQCTPEEAERSFRELIGRTDERLEDDILSQDGSKGVIADLYRNLPQDRAEAAREIEKRLAMLKRKLIAVARGEDSSSFGGWFIKYLRGLKPETLDRLEIWFPEDGLSAAYSVRGDGQDFTPIQQGSPGQRTAAMLAFLLAYGEEPMVLDQPEDDLDNHLIYDLIVRQIRENKLRRQLVVVTHNPNIVVNGDAELVTVMDFRHGQCRAVQSGCLQEQEVRAEICRVMEGGEQAFRQRYRRLVEGGGHA
ncbi:MAG: TrlF family AAA-like ATPase [Nitrospirota bacterium]